MRELLSRIGAAARGHKWVVLLAAAAIAIVSAIITTVAVQDGANFLGTSAAGSHQWWQDFGDQAFCERCHAGIGTELVAGPHSSPGLSNCTFCHGVQSGSTDEHAASTAKCSDCHKGAAADLTTGDAHKGITVDLGETDAASVSWTCRACHTHIEVTLEARPRGPLELIMGN